jgi:hypothetical protein
MCSIRRDPPVDLAIGSSWPKRNIVIDSPGLDFPLLKTLESREKETAHYRTVTAKDSTVYLYSHPLHDSVSWVRPDTEQQQQRLTFFELHVSWRKLVESRQPRG